MPVTGRGSGGPCRHRRAQDAAYDRPRAGRGAQRRFARALRCAPGEMGERMLAGEAGPVMMTEIRGAFNAKAKRDLG